MGTHLIVLIDGHPLNTNMTGFRCFSKVSVSLLLKKIAPALEGLIIMSFHLIIALDTPDIL